MMEDLQPPMFFIEGNPICEALRDRYCMVCGMYMDTEDLWTLYEEHGNCWQTYRTRGVPYPMPANV